ncbi:MAG: molecular chaperone Hsp20 [Flavobacteriaceae bacterium]|nr:MAG: molecular chaperone Hsp20 [Flavobacteriaceae bacterium]
MNLVKRNTVHLPSIIDEFLKPDWFGGMQNYAPNIPAVNIKETDTAFGLELAAPGKTKEDFIIEIDHNVLTISSETKNETEQTENNGCYTRREFSYTSFRRAFTLPETVNTDAINAVYENGVLLIALPKKEEALPKPKRLIDII